MSNIEHELWTLSYVASNGIDTENTLHLTEIDAARAGSELARSLWSEKVPNEPFPEDNEMSRPDVTQLGRYHLDMDVVRGEFFSVQLETEPITVSAEVFAALRAL